MLSPLESKTEYEASLALVSLFYNAMVSCDKYIYIKYRFVVLYMSFFHFGFYVIIPQHFKSCGSEPVKLVTLYMEKKSRVVFKALCLVGF